MTKKIETWNETSVHNVSPSADKAGSSDAKVKHPKVPGLAIRFRNGAEIGSYTFYYSLGGKDQTIAIAKVGACSLKHAEDTARKYAGMVSHGTNPAVEKAKAVTELEAPLRDLIDNFIAKQRSKGRSRDHIDRQEKHLNDHFAALHAIPIKLIERGIVARELNRIEKERGRRAMGLARATLSKFFSWAITQGFADVNPVSGTESFQSHPRNRVLQPKELAIIWQEAGDDQYGKIVRLLMLTGARRNQIAALRKHELNIEEALITYGGQVGLREAKRLAKLGEVEDQSLSKNRTTFLLPLSRQAMAILAEHQSRPGSRYVFGRTDEGAFSGFSKSMEELKERIGDRVKGDWGLHDFRRSFSTLGRDVLKIAPHIVNAAVNHIPAEKQGVNAHYNFAEYLDERIECFQKWGDFVESLIKSGGPARQKLRVVAA